MSNNKDQKTVDGFGDEWERFDQSQLSEDEHQELFNRYFSVFPWEKLPENPTGFDMGCGSGRWAYLFESCGASKSFVDTFPLSTYRALSFSEENPYWVAVGYRKKV